MTDEDFGDDERPANLIKANRGSSISSWMDNSVNKPMPWLVLCGILAAMGFAFGLIGYIASRDEKADRLQDRGELLSLINASENRVIADNQKKQTSFALLDNDYRKVLLKLEAQENSHAK